jgi:hypothetical protein
MSTLAFNHHSALSTSQNSGVLASLPAHHRLGVSLVMYEKGFEGTVLDAVREYARRESIAAMLRGTESIHTINHGTRSERGIQVG